MQYVRLLGENIWNIPKSINSMWRKNSFDVYVGVAKYVLHANQVAQVQSSYASSVNTNTSLQVSLLTSIDISVLVYTDTTAVGFFQILFIFKSFVT